MRAIHLELRGRHAQLVVGAVLALLPFTLLGHALLPGRVLSPADNLLGYVPWTALANGATPTNPLLADVVAIFHSGVIYAQREIAAGRFPLWNPHIFTGAPFFANPQSALLFPLTALAWALPVTTALGLMSILKFSAAGLAMFWFLRVLDVAVLPAAIAALGFMWSGVLVVWLQWTFSTTMLFLPLLLGLTERVRSPGGRRFTALLAVAVAFDLLAGYPQGAFVGVAVATAWALVRGFREPGRARFALRYVAAVTLGGLLAAVQIVPFLEYLRDSSALAYRQEWVPTLYLPLRAVATFLMPFYYGGPAAFWGDWNFNEFTMTVGVVPLLTLPLAILATRQRAATGFLFALALVSAAMLYGAPGTSLVAGLPMVSFVQTWRLTQPLIAFALTALAGLALDAVARGTAGARAGLAVRLTFVVLVAAGWLFLARDYRDLEPQQLEGLALLEYAQFVALVSAAAVLLLLWLREGGVAPRWGLLLGAVELMSLLPLAATYNPVIDARWFYPTTPALEYLERERARDHGRVLLGYNVAMVYGLADPAGYDGMTPRRLEQIVGPPGPPGAFGIVGSESLGLPTVFFSPVFDLLGVRHVVQPPGGAPPGPGFALAYDGPDARVYRNERALPRAFVVARGRCVGAGDAVAALRTRRVDLRNEVLLDDCVEAALDGRADPTARAEIRVDRSDRVVVDAVTASAGYLVLTDTWFPGWRATIDGVETRLFRADHAFRAVRLPPGRHEVIFTYAPTSFRLGLAVSAGAAVIVALCLAIPARRRSASLA